MARINDEAKDLDASLKKATGSARGLSLAIAESTNNLGHAVRAAQELGEAVAKAAKASEKLTLGIGTAIAVIGTIIAATVLWSEKQKEIVQQTNEIHAATAALNAQAQNNPRLEAEIKISAEKEKQLEAIHKEERALFGLGKHLHDYSGMIAAVNAQAAAAQANLTAGINRRFGRTAADIQDQAKQNTPDLAFLSDEERALKLSEAARESAIRHQREQGEDQGMNPDQINNLVGEIGVEFDNAAQLIRNEHIKPLGDALGRSFADSIAGGISAGIQAGSFQKGFRELTGGILIGFGQMLVTIGTQSLLAANLLNGIVSALKSFAPAGAIGPSLALIALGGILMGVGAGLGGGFGGGGGGGGGGSGFAGSGSSIIDRGIINPLNPLTGGVQPRANNVFNNTFIGPRDPVVQRQFQELLKYANARGSA